MRARILSQVFMLYPQSSEELGKGFLHDQICNLIILPTGRRSWRGTLDVSQEDALADCYWDSDVRTVGGRKEDSRDVGVGEGTLEKYRRWRQESPVTA